MLQEFKAFIMRGNVLDMAVGVIIGAAFTKIVGSFTSDILMPPLGLLLGKVDFSGLFVNLSSTAYATLKDAKAASAPTINYGIFLNTILDFVILAFAVFLLIRQVNRFQKPPEPAPVAATKDCPYCCTAIPVKATKCGHCTSAVG